MSYRLQVLIPEDLNARVAKAAQRTRVSKGAWVRGAMEGALAGSRSRDRGVDPLARLRALNAPTADIGQMNREIDKGRR
jgi:hypothetical protein